MNELEKKVVDLRKEGLTYKAIQLKLGNPSKKLIKTILKEYLPDMVGDKVENYGRYR